MCTKRRWRLLRSQSFHWTAQIFGATDAIKLWNGVDRWQFQWPRLFSSAFPSSHHISKMKTISSTLLSIIFLFSVRIPRVLLLIFSITYTVHAMAHSNQSYHCWLISMRWLILLLKIYSHYVLYRNRIQFRLNFSIFSSFIIVSIYHIIMRYWSSVNFLFCLILFIWL